MKKNIIVIIAIAAMCIVGMFIFKNEISNSLTNHITDKAMHETFKTNDIREIVNSSQLITIKDLQKRKFGEKISATWSKFIALFR